MEFIGIGNLDYFFSIVILKYTNFCSSLVRELLLTDNPYQEKNSWLGLDNFMQTNLRALENSSVPEHFSEPVGMTCLDRSS